MNRNVEKWIWLIIGTVIAALGMSLINMAALGNVILTVLWDGMSQKMPLSIGLASYMTSILMICFLWFYDRRQIRLGTIVHFLLFGAFMDFFNTTPIFSQTLYGRLSGMVLGVLLLSIGIGIYAFANLGRGPYEGICFAISDKMGIELKYVRTVLDASFAAIGFALGGSIGLATVVNLIMSGMLIQKTMETLKTRAQKSASVSL